MNSKIGEKIMIWINFKRWNSAAGCLFLQQRIYTKEHHKWTPFVKVSIRYKNQKRVIKDTFNVKELKRKLKEKNERGMIKEGKIKKGGVNSPPDTERPPLRKGRGGYNYQTTGYSPKNKNNEKRKPPVGGTAESEE